MALLVELMGQARSKEAIHFCNVARLSTNSQDRYHIKEQLQSYNVSINLLRLLSTCFVNQAVD